MENTTSKEQRSGKSSNFLLTSFFMLSFGISWLLWLPGILKSAGYNVPTIFLMIGMAANFGPSFSSLILTRIYYGKSGVKNLLKRSFNFKFNKIWLIPIFILPFVLIGIPGLYVIFIEKVDIFVYGIPIAAWITQLFMMFLTGGPLGEEMGWRGFALDRLLNKTNALVSSLILGAIWSLWHLPLFFIEGTTQSFIPFYQFFVMNTTSSILFTWLHNNTRDNEGNSNVMVAMLLHTMLNFAVATIPYWVNNSGRWVAWITQVIFVVILIIKYGFKKLSKK